MDVGYREDLINGKKHKKIIEVPQDKKITSNKITLYELTNAISTGIVRISTTGILYVEEEDLYINVDDLPEDKKKNIKSENVIEKNKGNYIKLTSTSDIAKLEINKNKCPLSVMRIIEERETELIVEIVKINDLFKPPLEYTNETGI